MGFAYLLVTCEVGLMLAVSTVESDDCFAFPTYAL
jgi:hypothetical protein